MASPVMAQNSSLYGQPIEEVPGVAGPTLQQSSWLYRPPQPPREIHVHDIVMIDVLVSSESESEGELQRRKSGTINAVLSDWVFLDGLRSVEASPQSGGDPTVSGSLSETYRAQGEMETEESLSFQIAAYVVDIRPNGSLVLEAHQQIHINEEVWEYSLSGVCRPDDINPDNSVLSRNIAEMQIHKRERGAVADGYRRGWFLRLYDTIRPF